MATDSPFADITIEDLLVRNPRASIILRRFGIVCIQCGEPVWGTLREVAGEKGITDLGPILDALTADDGEGAPGPEL